MEVSVEDEEGPETHGHRGRGAVVGSLDQALHEVEVCFLKHIALRK